MGVFSQAKKILGSIVSKCGEIFNSEILAKTGAKLQGRTSVTAKIIGNSKAYEPVSSNASARNVDRVNTTLAEYAHYVRNDMRPIEDAIAQVVEECFSVIEDTVDDYNLHQRFRKDCAREKERIKGSISQEISRRMSSSDKDCLYIMQMRPSEKKEEAMKEFSKRIQREALGNAQQDLSDTMDRLNGQLRKEVEAKCQAEEYRAIRAQEALEEVLENLKGKESVIRELNRIIKSAEKILEILAGN
jgi:hypothetical protein